jgi:hypothetical protein
MNILSRILSRIWNGLYKSDTSQVEILDKAAEHRKAHTGEDLTNWRSSIVDFCKLVDIDPSFANRRDLARELGMRAYSGSGAQNDELSKRLLEALRGD